MVVTANGEEQTNEEAQVYVHDLGHFVTVQFLEETPTVLSLGKLCKEHGYSYEWASGHKLRYGKFRISCCSKVVIQFWYQFVFNIDIQAVERRDEPAPGNWRKTDPITENQNKKKNGNRDSDDRLQDLPEWLEEFADNQEDTEMPVPAPVSQIRHVLRK